NPTAVADPVSATEAGGVGNGTAGVDPSGNVLANDTDVDSVANGETKTVVGVATGTQAGPLAGNVNVGLNGAGALNYGTLTIQSNGSYTYAVNQTNASVEGLRTSAQTLTDTFSYTMQDAAGASSTTQVTVTIHGQNDNPVANNDTATATEAGGTNNGTAGTNITNFNVLTGVGAGSVADTDVDSVANGETQVVQGVAVGDVHLGPALTTGVGSGISGAGAANYGTLTLNSNGSYSYTVNQSNATIEGLNTGGHQDDVFTYTMHDTAGATSNATITIHINGANDAPVAVNDGTALAPAYIAFESRTLDTAASSLPSVRANDTDVDNATNTLTATKDTNPGHGTVTVNADGSFTYTPTAGYLGGDSFTYHVTDPGALSSNSATAFIDVQPLVWHIDNNAAPGGDGSAAHPFNTIAAFNTANAGATHPDIVYLHYGTGVYSETDGIHLTNNQTLLGQGVDLTYQKTGGGTVTLLDADNTLIPTITVTGGAGNDGIHLAQNNTITGLNVAMNNAASVGIADNGGTVGNLNISSVNVGVDPDGGGVLTTSIGKAIDISHGGALNVTFGSVNSSGSSTQAIHLGASGAALTGSFAGGSGTLTGSSGAAFLVGDGAGTANTGGAATISYSGDVGSNTGRAVDIEDRVGTAGNVTLSGNISHSGTTTEGMFLQDNAAGTISFTGGSDQITTTTAAGVSLSNNTGAAIVFNHGGAGLDITSTSGAGFSATGGGTITVQNSGNSIGTTAGTALNLANVTVGTNGVTFGSASTTAAATGISIDTVGQQASSSGIHINGGSIAGATTNGVTINATSADVAIASSI
ncbi:MAG TPA: VCBS domain-containing protein, partial [Pseudonocardiaceae bacterium]